MLVFLLTFVILLLFQPLMKKFGPKSEPAPERSTPAQTAQAPAPAPPAEVSTPPAAVSSSKTKPAAPVAIKQASAEAETVVENDRYKITFTNKGAQVKSWILKDHVNEHGQPLDLVHSAGAQKYGYPLSLWSYDQTLRNKLNSVLYTSSGTGQLKAPADLTFEYSDADTTIRKTFHFDNSYQIAIDVEVTHNGSVVQAFPMWPSGLGDEETPQSYATAQVAYQLVHPNKTWIGTSRDVERLGVKNVSGGNTVGGSFYWAGVSDQYFAAIFLPSNPEQYSLVTLSNPIEIPKNPEKPSPNDTIKMDVLGVAVGNTQGHTSVRLFAGPKSLDMLDSVRATPLAGQTEAPNLRALVDLGRFSIIARPLFLWLRWTEEHWVGNWGWAIVVLTIIINIALLPLRLSSMKSAIKTSKIQPQINAIKEKYKKYDMRDPRRQQMHQETAALMKEAGVNPAAGCLPLIIQLPFLWAFYSMLGNTIELRHASWFYIHDLSAADPYHILPLLIIVTTFMVQRMTPQGGIDPQQQKVMNLMMPVMLGVISWNLSSGLCLYWVVGNLVMMGLQAVLNRTSLGEEMRAIAAKRARKLATSKK